MGCQASLPRPPPPLLYGGQDHMPRHRSHLSAISTRRAPVSCGALVRTCNLSGSAPNIICLLGGPGSHKGQLAAHLAAAFDATIINVQSLVLAHLGKQTGLSTSQLLAALRDTKAAIDFDLVRRLAVVISHTPPNSAPQPVLANS
ncbi:uncharacterized protein MONBRDRAFT_12674 [Monosiga brevicollis MX1]|uniref:Adenylate kinase n=1 Tax=Monosiga brevicollis TaxID=81824 RepID=A9VCZ5_MONBE|nr:uncharacterized protein MONBRDRAFT_12674 [Monosiga brevicollis MX1]EDQ84588.1 predicted protein [Monosiga brevicollis MX1]|eukprot:XP_001750615.1 hypothetical protein [Monosiga brevicollis MX1]